MSCYSLHPKCLAYRSHCCCLVTKDHVWLFCNPVGYNPPGSSIRGILQARILEWIAVSFSRGSSWARDRTHFSWIGRWILYPEPPGKPIGVNVNVNVSGNEWNLLFLPQFLRQLLLKINWCEITKKKRVKCKVGGGLPCFFWLVPVNLFFSPLGLTEDEQSPPRLQLILTQGSVRKFPSGHEAPGQFAVSISPSPPPTWTARRVTQHPFCSNTHSLSTHPFSAKLLGTFTSIYSWDEIYLPFQRWMNPMNLSSEP